MRTLPMSGALQIVEERARQKKRWSEENDDRQTDGELLECAIMVAADASGKHGCGSGDDDDEDPDEPWHRQRAAHIAKKYGGNTVQRLVIAGALIAAEIDRLQRKAKS